jgi:dinuclear metal center YbgI/SA1388 family protein
VAALQQIIANIDDKLAAAEFEDYCPNGLQVEGNPSVNRVVTGVSAGVELFERAVTEQAELIVVHHGIIWSGDERRVVGPLRERLRLLLSNAISLAAYHLPLDAHPQLGNNALIAEGLGAHEPAGFAWHAGRPIGVLATFPGEGIDSAELLDRVSELTRRTPLAFMAGHRQVRSLAIVSGAGTGYLGEAIAAGADAFITGEPTERAMGQARENAIHYIAAGHYATETFGVRALGAHIAAQFDLEHVFVDVPNPI